MSIIPIKQANAQNVNKHLNGDYKQGLEFQKKGQYRINSSQSSQSWKEIKQKGSLYKRKHNRKRRSGVWKFFRYDEKQNLACCLFCDYFLAFNKRQETTTLRRHILKMHSFTEEIRNQFTPGSSSYASLVIDGKIYLDSQNHRNTHEKSVKKEQFSDEQFMEMVVDQSKLHQTQKEKQPCFSRRPKRSAVWSVFKELAVGVALCTICEQEVKFKSGTTELIRHLKRFHGAVDLNHPHIQAIRQKNNPITVSEQQFSGANLSNSLNNYKYQFSYSDEISSSSYEEIRKIDQQIRVKQQHSVLPQSKEPIFVNNTNLMKVSPVYFPKESKVQVRNTQVEYQLKNQMAELCQRYSVSALQIIKQSNDTFRGLFISSTNMQTKLCHYKQIFTILYWRSENNSNYASIILIIAQDQNISPSIVGIVPVLVEDETFKNRVMSEISNLFLGFNFGFPKLLIIGPDWLKISFRIFTKNSHPSERQQLISSIIHIDSELMRESDEDFFNKKNQLIFETIMQKKTFSQQKGRIKFMGFSLSSTFIRRVKRMLVEIRQASIPDDILSILEQILQIQQSEKRQKIQYQEQQNKQIYLQMKQLITLSASSQLRQLQQSLGIDVMCKVLASYMNAMQYVNVIDINDYYVEARQKRSANFWGSNQRVWSIQFEYHKNQWICDCNLTQVTGIPCPHLIKILQQKHLSLWPYINNRWLIGRSNNSRQLQNNSLQNNKLKNNFFKLMGSRWSCMEESKFLQIFWS